MDVQHYEFKILPGLPPSGEPGSFLIEHEQFGWMIAVWSLADESFVATAWVDLNGRLIPQMVRFRDEQVPMALVWARLPLTRAEVSALT